MRTAGGKPLAPALTLEVDTALRVKAGADRAGLVQLRLLHHLGAAQAATAQVTPIGKTADRIGPLVSFGMVATPTERTSRPAQTNPRIMRHAYCSLSMLLKTGGCGHEHR